MVYPYNKRRTPGTGGPLIGVADRGTIDANGHVVTPRAVSRRASNSSIEGAFASARHRRRLLPRERTFCFRS